MDKCNVCQSSKIKKLNNFGKFYYSNFLSQKKISLKKQKTFNMILFYCLECGISQLDNNIKLIRDNFKNKWIKHDEPESHLNNLLNLVIKNTKITKNSEIIGISYKDKSFLNRFKVKGFKNTRILNYPKKNNDKKHYSLIDLAQKRFSSSKINIKKSKFPRILVCRHILEHSTNIKSFINSLNLIVRENDYILIEIPTADKFLKNNNFTMFWEEHRFYFKYKNFINILKMLNFKIVLKKIYSYPYEDCCVALISKNNNKKNISFSNNYDDTSFKKYIKNYRLFKNKIYDFFKKNYLKNKKIVIYGSGHSTTIFLNLFNIQKYVYCVLDDNKIKQNLYIPGTDLEIRSSEELYKSKIDICLLSLSYENEKKVRLNHKKFISKNNFISIHSIYKKI